MTQILGKERQGLIFEIIANRISNSDDVEVEKRYVIYVIQVRFVSTNDDSRPSSIERRYNQFLDLYSSLQKEHPQLMVNISFPKKKLFGNFDNALILERSAEFQTLLNHIVSESKLRTSKGMVNFIQNQELSKAKDYLNFKQFVNALPLLEQNFIILNKVFTDRSPVVLLALCRLLFCCMSIPGMPNAYKWGSLALHRYEGVSDSELLEIYIPLLHSCLKIYTQTEKDTTDIKERLASLQLQGITLAEKTSLEAAINKVEGLLQ